ncbi:MAG: Fic family protein [Lachnospiraceae bacterium]|nr:Fic family protein [Lachnospiraceae bacterium]
MPTKTSIRFFNKTPVRARWDEQTSSWWYAATDLIEAFVVSNNPRVYWNAFKKRNPELSAFCRQLKLTAGDGKRYNTDCLNEKGVRQLVLTLPIRSKQAVLDWLQGLSDPIDEQSKRRAYELYENTILDEIEVGTVKGLQQIHAFLFDGLYDFAGKIRDKNISKGGFAFANCAFFADTIQKINEMPDHTVDEILEKYVEMNIMHPFMEGNGRATRIWLDVLLKERVQKCVDWQLIDKQEYLQAMEKSPVDATAIKRLIIGALTEQIDDRSVYLKGIDYSYYYEEIE